MSRPARHERHRGAAIPSGRRPATSAWLASRSSCSARPASRASRATPRSTRDQQTRAYFQADGTVYATLAGEHQFKFGVQVDRIGNNVLSGESRNRVTSSGTRRCRRGVPVTRGQFGYYSVRSNGVDPKQGLHHRGQHPHDQHRPVHPGFVDDQQPADDQRRHPHRARARADLHVGRRTSRSSASSSASRTSSRRASARPTTSRATAARSSSASGASSTTSSSSSCRAARSAATSGSSTTTRSTRRTGRRSSTARAARRRAPGTLIRGPIDFRHPSFGADAIDPDLKPMRQQEATAGIEHQLNDLMALSARYVHKQVDRAIEDTGSLDADGNEIYVIANPGEGLTALAFTEPGRGAAEGQARLRLGRVRVREAAREQLVPARELHCGAGCSATTRA